MKVCELRPRITPTQIPMVTTLLTLVHSIGNANNVNAMLANSNISLTVFAFVNPAVPTPDGVTSAQLLASPFLPVRFSAL